MSDPAVETPGPGSRLGPGTRLNEFEIVRLVAAGSVGGLYLAEDRLLERRVAIKEFLPEQIAVRTAEGQVRPKSESTAAAFEAGRRSLLEEARLLAQVEHPSLVSVLRFWEANGTAYVVMPFYEGQPLREVLAAQPHLGTEQWLKRLAARMLGALAAMHAAGAVHGDLSPETVLILPGDQPMIVGLGATRRKLAETAPGLTVMVKPGFAPIEQYATDMPYGPWSDVYGVAAILYFGVTGKPPAPAITRVAGKALVPAANFAHAGFSASFLEAIDRGLALEAADRPQSAQALRDLLGIEEGTRSNGRMATGIAPTELRAAAAARMNTAVPSPGEETILPGRRTPTALAADGAGAGSDASRHAAPEPRSRVAEPNPAPAAGRRAATGSAASGTTDARQQGDAGSDETVQAVGSDALSALDAATSHLREQRSPTPERAARRGAPQRRLPMVPIAGGLAAVLLIALVLVLSQSPSDLPSDSSPAPGDASRPSQATGASTATVPAPSPPEVAPSAGADGGSAAGAAGGATVDVAPGGPSVPTASAAAGTSPAGADSASGHAAPGTIPAPAAGTPPGAGTDASPGPATGAAADAATGGAAITTGRTAADAQATSGSGPAGAERTLPAAAAPSRAQPPAAGATAGSQPRPTPQREAQRAPPASGTLVLSVRPWGEVFVDGQSRGVTPPLKRLPLAPGEHVIEIRNPAGSAYRRTIRIEAAQQLTLTHDF